MTPLRLLLVCGLLAVIPLSLDAALRTCNIQLVDGEVKKVCRQLKCPVNCTNGVCNMQLQRCVCNEGYEFVNGQCVPVCEPACQENWHCTAPNVCQCKDGYVLLDNQCQALCRPACAESQYCVAPNTCDCLDGYRNSTMTSDGCEPICTEGCGEHSRCKIPNQCVCDEGYTLQADGKCGPVCEPELCAHADCVAPYQCVCHAGYYLHFESGVCEPLTTDMPEKSDDIAPLIDVRIGGDP